MQKVKVKSHFSHQGKNYKPGEEFEGEPHEIETLAAQGHVEQPQSSGGTIGQEHGPGGQAQAQGAHTQQQTGPHDPPPKQNR